MSALEIVGLSVGAYVPGWALSTYWHLMAASRASRWNAEEVFGYSFIGLFWPITIVPQAVARLARREKKVNLLKTRQTRQQKKLAKRVETKQRELEAARQVRELQDEIDRIALS